MIRSRNSTCRDVPDAWWGREVLWASPEPKLPVFLSLGRKSCLLEKNAEFGRAPARPPGIPSWPPALVGGDGVCPGAPAAERTAGATLHKPVRSRVTQRGRGGGGAGSPKRLHCSSGWGTPTLCPARAEPLCWPQACWVRGGHCVKAWGRGGLSLSRGRPAPGLGLPGGLASLTRTQDSKRPSRLGRPATQPRPSTSPLIFPTPPAFLSLRFKPRHSCPSKKLSRARM